MQRTVQIAVAGLALTVAAAGCGGSTSSTSSTSSSASTSSSSSSAGSPSTTTSHTTEVSPSGDISDSQVYVPVTDPAGPFTVKVPEGWSRTEAAGAITFTDKLNSVRMEAVPAGAAPTVASATATEVPAIKAVAPAYTPGVVTAVQRTSGPAVLVTYRADSSPDPVTGKVIHLAVERYEFWKGGKEAILTLSGPVGADNVDPWKTVTDSFGWS